MNSQSRARAYTMIVLVKSSHRKAIGIQTFVCGCRARSIPEAQRWEARVSEPGMGGSHVCRSLKQPARVSFDSGVLNAQAGSGKHGTSFEPIPVGMGKLCPSAKPHQKASTMKPLEAEP